MPNTSVSWSPTGDRLLSCSNDAPVRVWTPDGTQTGSLPGPMSVAFALDWDPTGPRLATAHLDGVIRAWDGRSYQPLWTSLLLNDGGWVRIDPTGEPTASDPSTLDRQLVVVVEDDRGVVHLLSPSEFRKHR